ncbi:hypothetical protein, partial [Streptomyces sp. NPDC055509]
RRLNPNPYDRTKGKKVKDTYGNRRAIVAAAPDAWPACCWHLKYKVTKSGDSVTGTAVKES